jgi:hypothetical protein
VRFTLLIASAALAASLTLAGCAGGGAGSSAIPSGTSVSQMSHHGYHLVIVGKHPQSCQSPYYICYLVAPGSSTPFGWCLSTSGNCTSGVYDGKVNWKTNAGCGAARTDGPTGCTGKVKSKWGPPGTVNGLIYDTVTVKSSVGYTDGQAGYNATFTATAKSGSLKGESFTEPTGIIVGPY